VADYAFFALWFAIAQALAPADASVLTLENERHPEQRMQWVRAGDGAWAMTLNGRELGRHRRTDEGVVHETGQRAPDTYRLADLAEPQDLRSGSTRIRLRGRFAPSVLTAARRNGETRIEDPSGGVTPIPLRLRTARTTQ
jgi:hypothetical protein